MRSIRIEVRRRPGRATGAAASLAQAACAAAALLLVAGPAPAATPIADAGPPTTIQAFRGQAVTPHPIKGVKKPPRNPHLARNGRSGVHDDTWMTDAYWSSAPRGIAPETLSTSLGRVCITITFDRKGHLVASCVALTGPKLYMLDPKTLDTLATFDLPFVPPPPGTDPTQNTAGGAYFYLDNLDRAVVATTDKHLWVIREVNPGPAFALESDFDLSAALGTDRATSALPDWDGNLWFVGRYTGVVGAVDPSSGAVHSIVLGEEIENSFAVDRDGVYVVSDQAMYRFALDSSGTPSVVWRQVYQNVGVKKPGQVNAGSGTTPTIMNGGYVAITDNADPMNVVVYRTAATLAPGQSRTVCEVPVFSAGASATENSLIAVDRALIVENNYGYHLTSVVNGGVTAPGIARVDVRADGSGCDLVWTNTSVSAPSVVPKVSLRTGLVYAFTKEVDPVNATSDPWFWTALDFRTGAIAWQQLAGTGAGFNNHYAGICVGPNRVAYLGTVGGVVALRDGKR